jgi:glycosyltransferase involved in cell wall biosynthesis
MLVSIVTPSYNQGRFLRRTIDSVLTQSYPHIEYLVIDGGSTDNSIDILRSYGDRFCWLSEPDRGQAHALNKGFARARGEVLAYVNSDDTLLPGAVETIVRHFKQHPDWDVVYGRADWIDEHDHRLDEYPTHPFSFRRLMQYCFLCQPATFWRASAARQVGPFNERLQACIDYEYWLRLHRAGAHFQHLEDRLACSRLYGDTKTLSQRETIYREHIQICLEHVGWAELGPFYGLWRHRFREKSTGWPRQLRWLPGLCPTMALLDYLRSNRRPAALKEVLFGLGRGVGRLLAKRQTPVLR